LTYAKRVFLRGGGSKPYRMMPLCIAGSITGKRAVNGFLILTLISPPHRRLYGINIFHDPFPFPSDFAYRHYGYGGKNPPDGFYG
jgi:hypothetical protein